MCALIAAQDLYVDLYSVPTVALKWMVNIGMKEYLSKEFIKELLDAHLSDSNGAEHYAYSILKRELMAAPGSNVVEVKHGYWIETYIYSLDPHDRIRYKCSVCGRIEEYSEPYCNCGARMDM